MATTTTIDVRTIASPAPPQAINRGFKIPFLNVWTPTLGKGRSLAALIYLAMVSDGFASIEEQDEVYALIDRTRTLRNLNKKAAQTLIDTIEALIRKDGHAAALEKASREFRGKKSAESVFLHIADIVLADRALLDNEQRFLADAAFHLSIAPERAKQLFDIMRTKNRH